MPDELVCFCANCGLRVIRSGNNYRGDPRWVHRATNEVQCSLYATPKDTP